MNRVIIMGRLGQNPDIKQSNSGVAVGNFSVATNERKKVGDQWVDHTEWHKITVIGKTAENCGKYLSKGSQCLVEGKLQTRKWQDKDGKDRYTTEILAASVTFLDSKKETSREQQPTAQGVMTHREIESLDDDDDIPF